MNNLIIFLIFLSISFFSCSRADKELNAGKESGKTTDASANTIVSDKISDVNSSKYYLCMNFENTLLVDENIELVNDENGSKENQLCESILNKYDKNKKGDVFFAEYKDEFNELTKIKPGDKWYISTWAGIYESKIIGYRIFRPLTEYEFYPILERPAEVLLDVNNYDKNIYICGMNSQIGKLKLGAGHNSSTDPAIYKTLSVFERTITISEPGYSESAEIKIAEGNLINSGNREFVVSFLKKISFESFASGIIIMDINGNKLNSLSELTSGNFEYYRLLGIADIDGDGLDEILAETGYYEGNGFELWKLKLNKFEKIASGFYWGV